jgi:Rrf2 family transcriptional regulator, nitric oxide-sensitive transcriptional repressor
MRENIMLRNKTATYALLALYEIAQRQRDAPSAGGVRAGDIALKHKLPKAYAAKILSQMAGAGVLQSVRGPSGGFRLNRPIEDISLFDVFQSVGAVTGSEDKGLFTKGMPPKLQNAMTQACGEAADAFKEVFTNVHLADVLV